MWLAVFVEPGQLAKSGKMPHGIPFGIIIRCDNSDFSSCIYHQHSGCRRAARHAFTDAGYRHKSTAQGNLVFQALGFSFKIL